MQDALEQLLIYSTQDGRVCPAPMRWHDFWSARNRESAEQAPVPLILSAWWSSSDSSKAARLKEQLEWARQQGRVGEAQKFLLGLSDDDWHRSDRSW